ncbi:alpha/beta fold hydrolase [Streptomyces sp. NPDC058464]|uniref:alpha/beta fold hydrolase n=1 Tax=Streptomyces sp. NPDC058464 TaxID=3346511 RepID=UPI00364B7E8D
MPYVFTNGIRIAYERSGRGERVLMIMGSAAAGRVWTMHQTPALAEAGYQAITFDNRGIPPSDVPAGKYSLADMVADTRGVIEALALAPCRIVGASLGALIAQELMIDSPRLVRCAVLIATKARSDAMRNAQARAEQALEESGITLPPAYHAATAAMQALSPATLNDDGTAPMWLDTFRLAPNDNAGGGQVWIDTSQDRRAALREVAVPCRVIAFEHDLITPPHLAAEVAEALPDCDYVEIPACGHFGYLERPHEVNSAITEFLDKA